MLTEQINKLLETSEIFDFRCHSERSEESNSSYLLNVRFFTSFRMTIFQKFQLLATIIFFGISTSLQAKFHVEVGMNMTNDAGQNMNTNLVFGVDESATNGLDTALGEVEMPTMGYPAGVFQVHFEFIDSTIGEKYWTYKDLRPVPVDMDNFFVKYRLRIWHGLGAQLIINWSKLPDGIDSAKITDIVTGNIIVLDMNKSLSGILDSNWYWVQELDIRVWYNKKNVSVNQPPNPVRDDIKAYYNRTDDCIVVEAGSSRFQYSIYSVLGNKLAESSDNADRSIYSMDHLPPGAYILEIRLENGESCTRKILKH